ncbi:MAG: tetratricopeptide repeat protein [Flavobacteriaceae bacterium]
MRTIIRSFFILTSLIVLSQKNNIDQKSNNLTLDGNVEFSNKEFIEAETYYRKAISKDSSNNIASYNMGNSLYKSGLIGEASNEYKSSILKSKNKNELHKAYHNLGDVFMQNKDYQGAVNSFKKALLNNPKDDETRYNYALAKELLKNQQKNKNNKDNKKDNKKKDDKKDNKKDDKKDEKKKDDKKDDKKDEKKKDDKKDEKKKDDKKDDKKKPKPNKISPEQLKNLLKAMNNEEKKVQEKVNKNKIKGKPTKNKKDW